MKIDYDYLDRIRRAAVLFTKRKTSDLLEGDYRGVQHGRSLEFDDLQEYHYGDNINDIDWKSSSRADRVLVRRYIAERRHNVMIVADTGLKMTGDTPSGESKEEIALMTFGIAAYLFGQQGADYALAFGNEAGGNGVGGNAADRFISGFQNSPRHLEELLYSYKAALDESTAEKPGKRNGEDSFALLLDQVVRTVPRPMILLGITDAEGLAGMDERLIRRLTARNDAYFIKIEDAFLTTADAMDLDAGRFEDAYLTGSRSLRRAEENLRREMDRQAQKILTPYKVFYAGVSKQEQIIDTLIALLRRRREAS